MKYKPLTLGDIKEARQLMHVYAEAFEDFESYDNHKPSDAYLEKLLSNDINIILVAINDTGEVVGGIVAYELQKFEQERSEIYMYDLAVSEKYRRQGIATGLIAELKKNAKKRGVHVIFVQADNIDAPAIALYEKLASSAEKDITHFNIEVS